MKAEPTEIRLTRSAASRHATPRPADTRPATPANVSVLDEAFATVSEADFRRDDSHQATQLARGPKQAAGTETFDLSVIMREQLRALERQQSELKALLDGLD